MTSATVLSATEVGIDKNEISENALKVIQQLQDAGFTAYLVGGCVRDLVLGLKPKDFDVATNATPEQIKGIIKRSRIIGRRFKIVHVRFGYEVIEVATFRADASDRDSVTNQEMSEGSEGQLLRDNVYGSVEEDVARRDFRANSLYYDPLKGDVLDYLGGLEDIRASKLVSIGKAEQRFREDPVRMLRVVRFSAKLGFSMEEDALQMIEDEGSLLSNVSPARLFDEVLKLFHGGAAYETYLLLRKYGLFKYLFPFTDSSVIEGEIGMPERALKNTDKRIAQGKPVIPAFLFASMMWDPVKADAQILMSDGSPEAQAWKIAMKDGLRDQNQYVAVPRRLAEIIIDIWEIHFRLIKRNPRMIRSSLNNRRFRAAYDFLLLRSSLHEVDEEIAQWWTKIQEVDDKAKDQMIRDVSEVYKQQRQSRQHQHRQNREADGNSINYNSEQASHNSNRPNKDKGPRRRKTGQRRHRAGPRRNSNSRRRNQSASSQHNSNNGGSRYSNTVPKDEMGNHQVDSPSGTQRKVKVRHKRKILTESKSAKADEPSVF